MLDEQLRSKERETLEVRNSIVDLEEYVQALDGSSFALVMQKLDRVRAQNATLSVELHKYYDRLIGNITIASPFRRDLHASRSRPWTSEYRKVGERLASSPRAHHCSVAPTAATKTTSSLRHTAAQASLGPATPQKAASRGTATERSGLGCVPG